MIIAEISPRSRVIITELASQGLADVFIKMRLPFESDEVRHVEPLMTRGTIDDTWNH